MAFTSSLSAFGLKPATTSTPQQQQTGTSSFANAPPLGQNPNQPQQQQQNIFGAFGQSTQQNQQQPNQQSTSLFAQPQQQNQQTLPPGSLFGQPQTQNPTGSLFGQTQQQPQQQNHPAGTLFGQPQQQPQQQNQTLPPGSLFGQPQQQQNQTLPAGSLFGQPQQQNQPPGSLFGQPQQQQQQQQQQQPSNFFGVGSTTNTNNPQQSQQNPFGIGGFGTNTQQQQQPQQQSLFSTSTTNPLQAQPTLQLGAFGTNTGTGAFGPVGTNPLFNKSQQPQQQQSTGFSNPTQNTGFSSFAQPSSLTNSALAHGPPPFTKSTKFNDLPDNIKKVLELIDSYIQGRIQISKDLQQRKLGDEATKGNESIRALHKDLINTATIIRNDLHLTQDVKTKVDQAVEDTIVATRIIDGFRNPQSGNTYLKDHASFPIEYFTRVADQMKERLAWYKATIEQIEKKLSSSAASAQTPHGISATLQVQHGTFISLASKTAAVDAELQKIKVLYTQLWRAKTGSVRDPFNDNVKRSETPVDFGLGSLNVR